MILTQKEINQLGDQCGFGTPQDEGDEGDYGGNNVDYSKGMLWFDSDPTDLIRAVEKLILEKSQSKIDSKNNN